MGLLYQIGKVKKITIIIIIIILVADSKLLALATLRWNDERSVGVYEIDKIKKLKIKNAWQKMITPIDCTDIKSQQSIIVMIDREDRKFYDQVI